MPRVKKIALSSEITLSIIGIQDALGTRPLDDKLELMERVRSIALHIFFWSKTWDQHDAKSTLAMWIDQIEMRQPDSIEAIEGLMQDCVRMAEDYPVKLSSFMWIFKARCYSVHGTYSDDQARLLILEDFDKERKYFERLKQKHDSSEQDPTQLRIRIPEQVRIEVWRRYAGTCARCGGRENLEYDHIIPLSKGGSNTARNIELLCERCNRSKSASIG